MTSRNSHLGSDLLNSRRKSRAFSSMICTKRHNCGSQNGLRGASASRSGGMIFLGDKIEDELVWAARCKGCGELYVIREVGIETTFPVTQQAISCHKTHTVYEYRFNELETVWAP
jgi:hypothetical protein